MMPTAASRPEIVIDGSLAPSRVRLSPSLRSILTILSVAVAMLVIGAGANRSPVLFPDTIGYNHVGEAIYLAAFKHHGPVSVPPGMAPSAATPPPAATADDGISGARSPYYGFVLATATRLGGVWLAAAAQALVAAAALVFIVRRLKLPRALAVGVVIIGTTTGGLGFFAGVLIPDIFLGPIIIALALLIAGAPMSRGERWFWIALLVAGPLFHRGFMAVAIIVVIGTLPFWRAAWFDRRGWQVAAAACLIALTGHAIVGPVCESVLHKPMVTQPFVLARMAEGTVLTAYLDDVCPSRPFLLCRYRARLPLPHEHFLWYPDAMGGVYPGRTLAEKVRLDEEAGPLVLGAVAARPVAAIIEAGRLSIEQLFVVGMDDFKERISPQLKIDPTMRAAMAAYWSSGIVAGDYPLSTISRVTAATYLAGLAILAAALAALAWPAIFGRRRTRPVDRRTMAIIAIIVGALVANAVVSATLSGIHDRYQGRIAWLAALAAAAALAEAAAATTGRRTRNQ